MLIMVSFENWTRRHIQLRGPMKRKFRLAAFILCFMFIVKVFMLEAPVDYPHVDLFSNPLKNVITYWTTRKPDPHGPRHPEYLNTDHTRPSIMEQMVAVLASNLSVPQGSLGAWSGLKSMLHRSDLPGEVVESFREGLRAWRNVEQVVAENGREKDDKQCPYFVSQANATELAGGRRMALPCGMVPGSAITILATPLPGSLEFHIEITGAKETGGPPVILLYSVHLLGDQKTDHAVIIHNTWTSTTDWQEEERCPSPVELKPTQVDGLDRCVGQVGKISTWNPVDRKESGASSWPRNLRRAHTSKPWFPYVEGKPFVTTIWVGWEGFHVTVNGRHISSFPHRQSFPPWLVSTVDIQGDLQPVSVFATGLPVSRNMVDSPEAASLRAPPLLPKSKKLALFIGVLSSHSNFDQRMAQRRSWMQYEAVRSGNVVVRFFVGLHTREDVNMDLWKEANVFGDLQLLPFLDYYRLLALKTAAVCIFATKYTGADYIMKTDDDTYVRVDAVLSLIKKKEDVHSFLLGDVEMACSPVRDNTHKWYISREVKTVQEWPGEHYPPWAHGAGYIISREIAKFVATISGTSKLKLFRLEDVGMGIWMDEFQRSQNQSVQYIHSDKFISEGCTAGYVIAHYQTPRKMLCIWSVLQNTQMNVCCD